MIRLVINDKYLVTGRCEKLQMSTKKMIKLNTQKNVTVNFSLNIFYARFNIIFYLVIKTNKIIIIVLR